VVILQESENSRLREAGQLKLFERLRLFFIEPDDHALNKAHLLTAKWTADNERTPTCNTY
jgi:hypothetical protein